MMVMKSLFITCPINSRSQCKWSVEEKKHMQYILPSEVRLLLAYFSVCHKTDHKSLKYLLESPMQNNKIQMWAYSYSRQVFNYLDPILIYISLWIDCLFEIRKIAVCFLWLSLPGDYRVTDEALLAETM